MSERKLKESEEQIDRNRTLIGKEFFIALLNEINSYVDNVAATDVLEQTKDALMDTLLIAITQTQAKKFNPITKEIFSDYYKKAMVPGEDQLVKSLVEEQIVFSRKIVDLITNIEKQLNSVNTQIKEVDAQIFEIDKLNNETSTQTRASLKVLLGSFAQIAIETGKEVTRRVIKRAAPEYQLQNKDNTDEISSSEEQLESERNELQVRRSKQESAKVTLDEQYFIFQTYNNLLYTVFSSTPDYIASKITVSLIDHILKYLKINVTKGFLTSVESLKFSYNALLTFKLQNSNTSKKQRKNKKLFKVKRVPDIEHLNNVNSPKIETKKNFTTTDVELLKIATVLNFDELDPLAFKPVSPMQTPKIDANIRMQSPIGRNSISSFFDLEVKPEEPTVLQSKVEEDEKIQETNIEAEVNNTDENSEIPFYESFTEENNTNTQPVRSEAQVELGIALPDASNTINEDNDFNAPVEATQINFDEANDMNSSDFDVSAVKLRDKPVAKIVKLDLKIENIKENELYLENSKFDEKFFNVGEINYQSLLTLTQLQEKLIHTEKLKQDEVNTYKELNARKLQEDIFPIEPIKIQLDNLIKNLTDVNEILKAQKQRFINYKWEQYKANLPLDLPLTELKYKDTYIKLIEDKDKLKLLSDEESKNVASYTSTKVAEVSEKIEIDEKINLYIEDRITEIDTKNEQRMNKKVALKALKADLVKIETNYYSLGKLPTERSVYQNAFSASFDELIKDRLKPPSILTEHRDKFLLFLRNVANILLGVVSLGSVPLTRFFLKRSPFIGVETNTEKKLQELVEVTNRTLKGAKH